MVLAHRVLDAVGRSFLESFDMFWATLWALVLGFGLSGAVQAFAGRSGMRRRLGDHRPASVARAALYGSVSSSCSYAASAMARSLVARGADFVAAMVFMVASTNLVVELGIVVAVLLGWAFLGAEFVGGAVMIVLLVALGSRWWRGRALEEARARLGRAGDGDDDEAAPARPPLGSRLRSAAGWSDAAGYTMSDLGMLRREMVIGFLVAGALATAVPAHAWADVFVRGHGVWTSVENAAVAPLVAVLSFVCSVGNVPLAAALWSSGVSFGGVISFIFADLVTLPLLLVYRKQYGPRMAARMLGVLWLVMSASGLATEYLFRALGWLPTVRTLAVGREGPGLDPTTVLDVLALLAFAVLAWLHRHRDRFGGGVGYATDPVCGMQVEQAHAPATGEWDGRREWFCSEHCRDRFDRQAAVARSPGG